jgi:hypothetical protein
MIFLLIHYQRGDADFPRWILQIITSLKIFRSSAGCTICYKGDRVAVVKPPGPDFRIPTF